jgi:hypothetical protein
VEWKWASGRSAVVKVARLVVQPPELFIIVTPNISYSLWLIFLSAVEELSIGRLRTAALTLFVPRSPFTHSGTAR